jgi:uncharacterized protein YceK
MKSFLAWVIILVVLSGCAENQTTTNNIKGYQYTVPEKTNDGWEMTMSCWDNHSICFSDISCQPPFVINFIGHGPTPIVSSVCV